MLLSDALPVRSTTVHWDDSLVTVSQILFRLASENVRLNIYALGSTFPASGHHNCRLTFVLTDSAPSLHATTTIGMSVGISIVQS